ncbi:MAG: response regulator transcription factor [Bacteroidota bacterium]
MEKILIIEDDLDIVSLLEIHLQDLSFQVSKAYDGLSGLEMARNQDFDLVILDLTLPGIDGLEVCRRLRSERRYTPIMMLTARTEEIDKILGLEMGADDYLTKPFSVREFVARVKAILRRTRIIQNKDGSTTSQKQLNFQDLCIDLDKRAVLVKDKRVELSPKEFDLLSLLAAHPGKSFNRGSLLNLVWGYDFEGYEHTVNSHINRLRRKIEPDMGQPTYILTTWGVGYRFNENL